MIENDMGRCQLASLWLLWGAYLPRPLPILVALIVFALWKWGENRERK